MTTTAGKNGGLFSVVVWSLDRYTEDTTQAYRLTLLGWLRYLLTPYVSCREWHIPSLLPGIPHAMGQERDGRPFWLHSGVRLVVVSHAWSPFPEPMIMAMEGKFHAFIVLLGVMTAEQGETAKSSTVM